MVVVVKSPTWLICTVSWDAGILHCGRNFMAVVYTLQPFLDILLLIVFFPEPRQSHTTIAVVDRHSDGTYVLRALKQKLFVDGLCYLVQEIYGIENKNIENNKVCICHFKKSCAF